MKKMLSIIGIMLIFSAIIWVGFVCKKFTVRIPQNWSFNAEYLGSNSFADESGKLPKERTINIYKKKQKILKWSSEKVIIEDLYTTYDIKSGDITWQSQIKFEVDPNTGQIINHPNHPEASGCYYLFPQNCEKKDYERFDYLLNRYTMKFIREVNISEMIVFVYRFKGEIDETEINQGTADYPGIIPPKGFKIMSDNLLIELWIEPDSGEIVKVIEDSPLDYYKNIKTGENGGPASTWKGKTTGNTLKLLARRANTKKHLFIFYRYYIPFALLLVAAIVLYFGRWRCRNNH